MFAASSLLHSKATFGALNFDSGYFDTVATYLFERAGSQQLH